MKPISEPDIQQRIARDNPWWERPGVPIPEADLPRRVYFDHFKALAMNFDVRRAAVLLGPRRVGKTVMIKQLVAEAINSGFDPCSILYASIDAPIYLGISLEKLLEFLPKHGGDQKLIIFDEIQYLKGWEIHLKDLVDNYPKVKFVVTGSAAAALKLKSKESGAGRFSEFMLPPLTFYEFLQFTNLDDELIREEEGGNYSTTDIDRLNDCFVDYLNYGGYPEAVMNKSIRDNADQFIRNDIIDKVLLKDLPSLYGINEIQELNRLFSFLAYNAGGEASLENISQGSGLAKQTIKKYIEYLESAFLVIKVSTVDENCRSLTRERNFKIYLNNPSMRAALFAPVQKDDPALIGHLAECAVFSQWQHSTSFKSLRYARWRNEGEIDVVYLQAASERPQWIGEIKWSDRIEKSAHDLRHLIAFLKTHNKTVRSAFITSRTVAKDMKVGDRTISVIPTSLYCYTVGRNITASLDHLAFATVREDVSSFNIDEVDFDDDFDDEEATDVEMDEKTN